MAKRRRKFLLATGILLLGGLLFLAAVPLWLPLVLRPAARKYGARFQTYSVEGYSRFVLREVVFTNKSLTIHAARAELYQPLSWLWFVRGSPSRQPVFARLEDWDLSITSQTNAAPRSRPLSTFDQVETVDRVLKELRQWLPTATATNGVIQFGTTTLHIAYAAWSHSSLQARADFPQWRQSVLVSAQLPSGSRTYIDLTSETLHLHSVISALRDAGGISVFSTNMYFSNRFEVQARFGGAGLLPENAQVKAPFVTIPGVMAGLKNYDSLNGGLEGAWKQGTFELKILGAAQPSLTATHLPPMNVELAAHGDTELATVSSFTLNSPGLTAQLSAPLTFHFHGPLLRENAAMHVVGDLAAQAVIPAQGKLEGKADFFPEAGRFPDVHFRVEGKGVGVPAIQTQQVITEGMLNWPNLAITNARVTFEDGTVALVRGEMDLQTQLVKAGSVQISGTPGCKFLPRKYVYENAAIMATFQGAITNLAHQGQFTLTNIHMPGFPPIQLQGEWNGALMELDRVALNLQTTNSSVVLIGAVSVHSGETFVSLSHLVWNTNGHEALRLSAPIRADFKPTSGALGWRARLEEMHLAGKAGDFVARASVDWPRQGSGEIHARGWSTDSARDFIPPGPGTLSVENLSARAAWSNGPVQFQIALALKGKAGRSIAEQFEVLEARARKGAETNAPLPQVPTSFRAEFSASGGAGGIVISNLTVNSDTSSIVTIRGTLPLRIEPGNPTNIIQIDEGQPMEFSALTQPRALLWEQLSAWTGVALVEPDLRLQISGTWANPLGSGKLTARKIRLPAAKGLTPTFEDLNLRLELDREAARLVEGSLRIQRQAILLTGDLPLGKKFWEGIRETHYPDLRQASAHLQLRKAELAALAELYPTLLSPEGEVNADVQLSPGQKLRGEFTLNNGRTRPFPGIGPVRDINVSLKLSETEILLESASAYVGGAEVILTGKTAVPDLKRLGREWPPFKFELHGTNVPLSRQPESIIRSDLNLSLVKSNGAPALITGAARLRDSFYLSDVTALIPARVASPRRRPPYFSIETPELANWRVAVKVTGENALRVRSTLFNGEASAHLQVLGTLENPLAIGDLQIDSGSVKFPFGVLEIKQGFVILGAADPYRPQLSITAGSKQFGYDVRMEVTGPADQPIIQFSSTPPLSSEQIVLMITAGQVPNSALNITPQQRAQTVALYLGKDLLGKLGFGDDSKDRLSFRSGEEISEQGRPTYNVEYKLSKRWSLEGENDRFNAYNAGLKWHVYSK